MLRLYHEIFAVRLAFGKRRLSFYVCAAKIFAVRLAFGKRRLSFYVCTAHPHVIPQGSFYFSRGFSSIIRFAFFD